LIKGTRWKLGDVPRSGQPRGVNKAESSLKKI
jgi:hypothetical protein